MTRDAFYRGWPGKSALVKWHLNKREVGGAMSCKEQPREQPVHRS